jgi:hypothetical protein
MVVLVPSNSLNPESCFYYENGDIDRFSADKEKQLFKKP